MIFLGTLMATGTVIASPTTRDQEPPSIVLDPAFDWIALWPIPAAIVAFIVFLCLPDTRLRRPRLKQWRWSPTTGLILFVVALLAALMAASIAGATMGSEPTDIEFRDISSSVFLMLASYVGQLVILLLVPGLLLGLIMARRDPVDSDHAPVSWWRGTLAGLGGLILFFPMVTAVALLAGLFIMLVSGQVLPDIGHATLAQLQDASSSPDAWFIVFILLIVLVTPILEEVMYRGLLQESIRRSLLVAGDTPWLAILITSIIFAMMHGAAVDLRGMLALFVLSLGFGWVYLKTGRLLASIVMHAGFNAVNLLQVLA